MARVLNGSHSFTCTPRVMKVMEDERGDNGDELACVKETESQDADEMNQKVDSRDKE